MDTKLAVEVADDHGRPLSGVAITMDDTPIAVTDGQGRASAIVQSQASARVRVRTVCPDDYRAVEPRLLSLARGSRAPGALELRVTCPPTLRTLAVVVRAPGAEGLTLRADGAPVAKVQPDGTAHVVLQRAPDTTLRLSLDTSDVPTLQPQFPAREVHVADRDEIVVFDEVLLATAAPRKRVPRRRVVAAETRHVPYSIGRAY